MSSKNSVCIIGLGYVGLPLACLCASKGIKVYGFDVDSKKVGLINKGLSPIKDPHLEKEVKKSKGKILATTEEKIALDSANTVVVCVPTPIDQRNQPDLKPLTDSIESISRNLKKRQLILVESTIYPGTINGILKPLLEKSGLVAGKDFFLAHCPERIDPGNEKWNLEKIPRVLGGVSAKCTVEAKKFYKKILKSDILVLDSIEDVEAVKVFENTFRDVNIAFVNEMAKSFDKLGIDISEVVKGASTKPFGFMPFYPGPGVGGHCIKVDPYYLIARAKEVGFDHQFLSLAREINNSMPKYTVSIVEKCLEKTGNFQNPKIAVLGLAYKANVDDLRETPTLEIIKLLREKKFDLKIFDPFIAKFNSVSSVEEAIEKADCIVIATNHSIFLKKLSPKNLKKVCF